MAWIAVDLDGQEYIYQREPRRFNIVWGLQDCNIVRIPKGTSLKLTGKQMNWDDNPIELK